MNGSTLTMLVHGEAGAGKSWFGNSAPAPRLVLDAETRGKYLPGTKTFWDPYHEEPPKADGSWETCIAVVPDFQTMNRVYQWLQSGQHPFVSVSVDSFMEVQKRLIDDLVGVDQLQQQDWGAVLRNLEKLARDYRDLTAVPSNPVKCVVFTCGTKNGDGKYRPLLQGSIANTLPYFVDTIGFLYTSFEPETRTISRHMLVQPTPQAVAKDDTGRIIGPVIDNPTLTELFARLETAEAAAAGSQPTASEGA